MLAKIKGEVAAAIAVGAGLLLAAGYCITWAGLSNENLPSSVILSALPQTYYYGAAISALVLPLVILATFGTVLVALPFKDRMPGRWEWAGIGLALALLSKLLVALSTAPFRDHWETEVLLGSLVATAFVVAVTVGLGGLTTLSTIQNRLDRVQVGGAVLLVAAIVSTSAFQWVHARHGDRVLPQVVAFLKTEDCPRVDDITRTEVTMKGGETLPADQEPAIVQRCSAVGFYIGESDKWMYLARRETKTLPARLLFIPRDSVVFAGGASELLDPFAAGLPPGGVAPSDRQP